MNQGEQTKTKILTSADELFYRNGFHQTAISDIVNDTGMSKGNITYHFRSKEDILSAVFKRRLANTKKLLNILEEKGCDSGSCLEKFVDVLLQDKSELVRYGCPNGSLAYELGKSDERIRDFSLKIFDCLRNWFMDQFLLLGYTKKQSKDLSMQFFIKAQGICILSQVYNSEKIFKQEIKQLKNMAKRI